VRWETTCPSNTNLSCRWFKLKTGFSTLGCPELTLEQIVELAVRHSMDGVELRGAAGEHIHPIISAAERREIAHLFKKNHIEIFSITAYTTFESTNSEVFHAAETELLSYAQLAQDIGASFIRTFVGGIPAGIDPVIHDKRIAESLAGVAHNLHETDVSILVETHDRISSVRAAQRIVSLANDPHIGILWDIAHSLRAGDSITDAMQILGERLGYVHLKDESASKDGEEHPVLPGKGIIPIKEISRVLETFDFKGFLCLEWERKWHPLLPSIEVALSAFKEWIQLE